MPWEQTLQRNPKAKTNQNHLELPLYYPTSQLILSDDAINLTNEKHDPNAQMSHLHKRRKQKDFAEGTGVVPAKYPLKVKLEIFSQL